METELPGAQTNWGMCSEDGSTPASPGMLGVHSNGYRKQLSMARGGGQVHRAQQWIFQERGPCKIVTRGPWPQGHQRTTCSVGISGAESQWVTLYANH